jgi:hypothetical protein
VAWERLLLQLMAAERVKLEALLFRPHHEGVASFRARLVVASFRARLVVASFRARLG